MAVETKTLEEYLVQVRRIAEHREVGSEAKIRKMFAKLKKELTDFVGAEYAKYAEDDKLDFAILQKNREYARFLEEVVAKFDGITPEVQKEVQSLIEETYKTCYAGMVDGVQKCAKTSELRETFTSIKAISPAHVKAAVKNPVDKLTLKPTLERNRKTIISNIQREIGIGLNNGDRMSTMARRIQKYVDQDYRKSVLIARTEAHRVREVGFNDSAARIDKKLAESGAEYRLVKTWRTMQDGAVRHTNLANHRDMDDVSVLQDEDFTLTGGAKAPCPGMSGIAAEDCNCRCYVERELMTDAEYFAKTGKHFEEKPFTNDDEDDIIFNNASTEEFAEAVQAAKDSRPLNDAWRVTAMSKEEFEADHPGAICHITRGGSTAAVIADGDIVSVCKKLDDRSVKGAELLQRAVDAGGVKLDSYAGNHGFYASHGFEPVSWCKWDDNGADEGWINQSWLKVNGLRPNITTAELRKIPDSALKVPREDIIFYKYTGKISKYDTAQSFKNAVLVSADYDEAQKMRDYLI